MLLLREGAQRLLLYRLLLFLVLSLLSRSADDISDSGTIFFALFLVLRISLGRSCLLAY